MREHEVIHEQSKELIALRNQRDALIAENAGLRERIEVRCTGLHQIAEPAAGEASANVWQQALDRELASSELGVAGNDATQEQAEGVLHVLICRHIAVATDPATNGGKVLVDAAAPMVLPRPSAVITSADEYGPAFGWHGHWTNFPVGTKFYTEQQVRAVLAAALAHPAA